MESNKYHIIYADPPWSYNARRSSGTKFGGGAMGHYDTMNLEQIKALPVQNICEDNSVLFLWVTFPKLQEGLAVMEAWGFKYVTLGFSWHKLNQKSGNLFFGVGSYTKSNCEVCLLGKRGKVGISPRVSPFPEPSEKMVVRSHRVSSAIQSTRGKHSQKPQEARERIVELFGDLPRIELFARVPSPGWHIWGNQVVSDVEL